MMGLNPWSQQLHPLTMLHVNGRTCNFGNWRLHPNHTLFVSATSKFHQELETQVPTISCPIPSPSQQAADCQKPSLGTHMFFTGPGTLILGFLCQGIAHHLIGSDPSSQWLQLQLWVNSIYTNERQSFKLETLKMKNTIRDFQWNVLFKWLAQISHKNLWQRLGKNSALQVAFNRLHRKMFSSCSPPSFTIPLLSYSIKEAGNLKSSTLTSKIWSIFRVHSPMFSVIWSSSLFFLYTV